jgi:hypothetical protein
MIADNKELLPEATSPMTQTNEPFLTYKLIERRQIYESKVLSFCSFFFIPDDSTLLVALSSNSFLSLSKILSFFCYSFCFFFLFFFSSS